MHINLSNYKYTHDWFLFCELRKLATIFFHPDKKHTVLEIGSFEGLSACGIIDNLFEHSESHIDCVDPFDIGDTTTPLTEISPMGNLSGQQPRGGEMTLDQRSSAPGGPCLRQQPKPEQRWQSPACRQATSRSKSCSNAAALSLSYERWVGLENCPAS